MNRHPDPYRSQTIGLLGAMGSPMSLGFGETDFSKRKKIMSMFKPIRWLACVAAVGIAVLGWASPSRADLEVTLTDANNLGLTTTYTDAAANAGTTVNGLTYGAATKPGEISLSGTFGSFTVTTLAFNANYDGGVNATPPPGNPTAHVTDATITATNVGGVADTLTAVTLAQTYTTPSGSPLTLTNGLSSTFMSGTGDNASFNSTFTSNGLGGSAQTSSTVNILGPIPPPASGSNAGSTLLVTNPNNSFKLGNTLTLTFGTGGNAMTVNGTTTVTGVPEPSTMAIAGIGALGMIGYGLRRRKARGA